ncbi:MAG: MBL fold metallo-hydrolase [Pseudomonadota bacterium]
MRIMLTVAAALSLSGCGSLASDEDDALPDSSTEIAASLPRAEQPTACPAKGAALQVLGSGGPIAEAARAATSYLLWIDGEPRLLIDAGAGSFLRYAEAGGKLATLDAILLTHLHADHAGDLVDILNSGGFEERTEPLPVVGPDAAPRFPGMSDFIQRLVGKDGGAFAYNGGYIDGTENKPELLVREIATAEGTAAAGIDVSNDFSVMAHPVNHGVVPALGYMVEVGDASFVITGDQSGLSERFLADLTNSKPTILFAHHVINGEDGQPRGLHRTPAQIGELAGALKPGRLVLTHNMERSLGPISDSLAAIKDSYSGDVSVAADLDCYAL